MAVTFRTYTDKTGLTPDYYKVRAFLVDLGYKEYTYTRWDWMITHSYLDTAGLAKIGLWEDQGKLVGLATIDCSLGQGYCLTQAGYEALKRQMLVYSKTHLSKGKDFKVIIADDDHYFQAIAASLGFGLNAKVTSVFLYSI